MNNVRLSEIIASPFKNVYRAVKKEEFTHFWLSGGRGSTKSSVISIIIILEIMKDPNANAVVLRKVKDTLNESVKEQLIWAINTLKVEDYWDIPDAKLTLTYKPTGQQIRFRGADKPKKIKGIKFAVGYTKLIWYEELDEFTDMAEIRMINQSLMRGGPTPMVFYSYNPPKSANNWVNYEKTITRPDRLVHHSNYLDVPKEWLGPQFIIEAEHLRDTKFDSYRHEYLGEVIGSGGQVFENVKTRQITDDEIKQFECVRRGADFGFAIDPFSYVVCNYDRKRRRLYIYHELFKVGLSNTQAIKHIKEENKQNDFLIADSAEPKSIHEFRQHGLRVKGAKKGPDSIEYGIKFLQHLDEIIIDDIRCPNTAREFLTYEMETDAQGNYKAVYGLKNNHSIDAVRYALNDEVMNHKEHKKAEHDPDNPTPQEKHEKMVRQVTGKKPKIKSMTKW
jgi:PBSX family phage terminase large subunit